MASLNEFISSVAGEGLMRTSRFTVTFTPPAASSAGADLRKILLYCDNINLPGLTLETTAAKTYGEHREMPHNKLFDTINIGFYVDNSMTVKKLFDDWMGTIQDPVTRNFNYYWNYTTDLTVDVFDIADQSRYQVVLYQCYPKAINPIQMDYANKDVMKLSVAMNYKYWKSSSTTSAPPNGVVDEFLGDSVEVPSTYYTDFPNYQSGFNSFENSRSSLYSSESASVGQGSILI
jgi:hypothetical protein